MWFINSAARIDFKHGVSHPPPLQHGIPVDSTHDDHRYRPDSMLEAERI